MTLLEVCANSVTSALAAQNGGAARIELCENLHEGGTTPSYGQIQIARRVLQIPINVLLRPRPGNFLYSDMEYDIMLADLNYIIATGCNGVVLGIINANGSVDMPRCRILVNMAKQHGLTVTFHRAVDVCEDMISALDDIIDLGCDYLLTSGGKTTAIEGAGKIVQLIQKAEGRINIMPGGGISEYNVADIVHFTGVKYIHSSARVRAKDQMTYHNERILVGSPRGDNYGYHVTDTERVKEIISNANSGMHH